MSWSVVVYVLIEKLKLVKLGPTVFMTLLMAVHNVYIISISFMKSQLYWLRLLYHVWSALRYKRL